MSQIICGDSGSPGYAPGDSSLSRQATRSTLPDALHRPDEVNREACYSNNHPCDQSSHVRNPPLRFTDVNREGTPGTKQGEPLFVIEIDEKRHFEGAVFYQLGGVVQKYTFFAIGRLGETVSECH
jgi:hypothetical protein